MIFRRTRGKAASFCKLYFTSFPSHFLNSFWLNVGSRFLRGVHNPQFWALSQQTGFGTEAQGSRCRGMATQPLIGSPLSACSCLVHSSSSCCQFESPQTWHRLNGRRGHSSSILPYPEQPAPRCSCQLCPPCSHLWLSVEPQGTGTLGVPQDPHASGSGRTEGILAGAMSGSLGWCLHHCHAVSIITGWGNILPCLPKGQNHLPLCISNF